MKCPIRDGKYEEDETKQVECSREKCPFWWDNKDGTVECRVVIFDGRVTTREAIRG